MSALSPQAEASLSREAARAVCQACDALEAAWKSGLRPRLSEALESLTRELISCDAPLPHGGDDPGRSLANSGDAAGALTAAPPRAVLLRELLSVELDFRIRNRETPSIDEYCRQLPADEPVIREIFQQKFGTTGPTKRGETSTLDGNQTEVWIQARPPRPAPGSSPIYDRIDRYRILEVIGSGGFGTVYLAEHEQLRRLVAVKVPHGDRFQSEADIEQFLSEARKAARLSHPGIVTVHDAARQNGGVCFIVMEYVPGRSLADVLAREHLSPLRSAELALQVAEALQHAHEHGIVHRDIKPGNILLDDNGQPHVADFGLALHKDETAHASGPRAGTPSYMSPEQIEGRWNQIDAGTDIWALGAVLYEMLTGQRPFKGDSKPELADRILRRELTPPRQIDPRIPEELERICLTCLARSPAERYPSAAALAGDLHNWVREVKGEAAGAVRRFATEFKLGNLGCGFTVTLGCVLIAGGVLLWKSLPEDSMGRRIALDQKVKHPTYGHVDTAIPGAAGGTADGSRPATGGIAPPGLVPPAVVEPRVPGPLIEPPPGSLPTPFPTRGGGGEESFPPRLAISRGGDERALVPAQDEVEAARRRLEVTSLIERFRRGDAESRQAAVRAQLQRAAERRDDRAEQFVLLQTARELAAEAGDCKTALQAADQMTHYFAIDPLALKAETLSLAAHKAAAPQTARQVVEVTMGVLADAVTVDHYEAAEKLLQVTREVAAKSPQPESELAALRTQLPPKTQAWLEQKEQFDAAVEVLQARPDDPAANLAFGRYQCLFRRNWSSAINALSKSDDAALHSLAQAEATPRKLPAQRLGLARDWRRYAQQQSPLLKLPCLLRASHWYDQAMAGLEEDVRAAAMSELAEVQKEIGAMQE